MIRKILLYSFLMFFGGMLTAQQEADFVRYTFGGPRLIHGHSIETLPAGWLNFTVSHRFGPLEGVGNFFGLDGTANFRLGLAYGLTDRLSMGVGRSRMQKRYDGFLKYKILAQRTEGMPVSLTVLTATAVDTDPWSEEYKEVLSPRHRLGYTTQLMVARKFGERISLQLTPTFVHRNLVPLEGEFNSTFALGGALRYKFGARMALTAEYFYRFQRPDGLAVTYRDPIAISWDIETPFHRFQLLFTNGFALDARGFIPETTENPFDGGIRFGFNISRIFRT